MAKQTTHEEKLRRFKQKQSQPSLRRSIIVLGGGAHNEYRGGFCGPGTSFVVVLVVFLC